MNREKRIDEMLEKVKNASDSAPPKDALNAAFKTILGFIVDPAESHNFLENINVFYASAIDSKYWGRLEININSNAHRVLFFKNKKPQHYLGHIPWANIFIPSEILDAAKHLGWVSDE